jgi:hypothetical protein
MTPRDAKQWSECNDAIALLRRLGKRATSRKLRLLVCAACRSIWPRLTDERSRRAVEMGEWFADDRIDPTELLEAADEAIEAARVAREWIARADDSAQAAREATALNLVRWAVGPAQADYWQLPRIGDFLKGVAATVFEGPSRGPTVMQQWHAAQHRHADLVRDLFGNPFQRVKWQPVWLEVNDGVVRRVAESIYEERAFEHLPILADALEDAGCDSATILDHCRQPREHARGCWVVDRLLGKE